MPSEEAEPLSEIGLRSGELPVAVGSAIDCTNVPDAVNSSMNKGADVPDKDVDPSPARQTTTFPGVNAAARSPAGTCPSQTTTANTISMDDFLIRIGTDVFMFNSELARFPKTKPTLTGRATVTI
jgi:hypothetical protein